MVGHSAARWLCCIDLRAQTCWDNLTGQLAVNFGSLLRDKHATTDVLEHVEQASGGNATREEQHKNYHPYGSCGPLCVSWILIYTRLWNVEFPTDAPAYTTHTCLGSFCAGGTATKGSTGNSNPNSNSSKGLTRNANSNSNAKADSISTVPVCCIVL